MRLSRLPFALALLILASSNIFSQSASPAAPAPVASAPDYAQPDNWVCRPGREDICTKDLDAVVVTADGHKTPQAFAPAANPTVDCFYVYPTVSLEPTPYADLTDSPEIQRTTKAQVGRLTSRCRVFAPIYRQATLAHLRERMGGGKAFMDSTVPADDVKAAWNYYLQHDNHGRGVIIVGHSQGTILLQDLIASDIDGKPAQKLLISAFLAGDPSLGVPAGKLVGGTFKQIPVCSAAAQTGCVYAWGSAMADDHSGPPVFGRARTDGLVSACANPAAPAGGSGPLKFYYATHDATIAPWIETGSDRLSGACTVTDGANVFRITATPGPSAEADAAIVKRVQSRAGWGVHSYDVSLVLGNILDVVDAELVTWRAHHK